MQSPQHIPPSFDPAGHRRVDVTMPLVYGVLGLMCCGLFAPLALSGSNDALAEIAAGHGNDSDRTLATIAKVLGIVGIVILVGQALYLLFVGFVFLFARR